MEAHGGMNWLVILIHYFLGIYTELAITWKISDLTYLNAALSDGFRELLNGTGA